jgi:hypothetical protein
MNLVDFSNELMMENKRLRELLARYASFTGPKHIFILEKIILNEDYWTEEVKLKRDFKGARKLVEELT